MKTTSERKLWKYHPNINCPLQKQLQELFHPRTLPPGIMEAMQQDHYKKKLRLLFHTAGLLKEGALASVLSQCLMSWYVYNRWRERYKMYLQSYISKLLAISNDCKECTELRSMG